MKLFDELKYRGLIDDMTSSQLGEELNNGGLTFYIRTDPTGDSLRTGHYSSLLCVRQLKECGHHPIMLVGGATGLIGGPKASGERNMLTKGVLEHNYQCLSRQIGALSGSEVVNNPDWTRDISVIDFLRGYGKYFNADYMINKEVVERRLDAGISYTKFSYMTLQALDFLHLCEDKGCTLQPGGQDQRGNITSGLELIRRKHGVSMKHYGLTMPLIIKTDGTKFGGSKPGTAWLDKYKTSACEMYQFLVNSKGEKVIDYLKKLTFLSKEGIDALEEKVKTGPYFREAQKILTKEVVTFLHGEEECNKTLKITNALSKGNIKELDTGELQDALKGFEAAEIAGELTLADTLVQAGIASDKREAREWINQDSIQINGDEVKDVEFIASSKNAISRGRALIRKGKRGYFVISQKQSRGKKIVDCGMKDLLQSAFFVKP